MKSRNFFKSTLCASLSLQALHPSIAISTQDAAGETTQPDILLIMPDQWRGDALSILDCAGVTTPQLDQLAREGALFRRAYATVPVNLEAGANRILLKLNNMNNRECRLWALNCAVQP